MDVSQWGRALRQVKSIHCMCRWTVSQQHVQQPHNTHHPHTAYVQPSTGEPAQDQANLIMAWSDVQRNQGNPLCDTSTLLEHSDHTTMPAKLLHCTAVYCTVLYCTKHNQKPAWLMDAHATSPEPHAWMRKPCVWGNHACCCAAGPHTSPAPHASRLTLPAADGGDITTRQQLPVSTNCCLLLQAQGGQPAACWLSVHAWACMHAMNMVRIA